MAEESGRATAQPAAGLGARIGALRVHAGWSQPELAARAGVSKAAISKLEAGKTGEPEPRTRRGLVRAFGWPDYEAMVASTDLDPPARAAPPERDEFLAEMFSVLLGVRRDVRTLLEAIGNDRTSAGGPNRSAS